MIYPYKAGSASVKVLCDALGVKQIKTQGSKFKGNEDKIVINWGASKLPEEVNKCTVINTEEAVSVAADKLKFFNATQGKVNIPEFTTDVNEARVWSADGKVVVARTKLNGHSGEGLHIIDDLPHFEGFNHYSVKLYVKYIPKKEEYRIHVVNGEVIDSRRKALSEDFDKCQANWKVRSHQNGFIFAKDGFEVPEQVSEQAILAVNVIGLDFGAVDVIWNNFYKKAYVLEINTAPGLEGSSVDNYKEAFDKIYEMGAPEFKKYKFDNQNYIEKYILQMGPDGEVEKVLNPALLKPIKFMGAIPVFHKALNPALLHNPAHALPMEWFDNPNFAGVHEAGALNLADDYDDLDLD